MRHVASLVILATVLSGALGAQTFSAAHTTGTSESARQVVSIDLNHDGYADLVVLQPNSQGIGVKMNLRNKAFGAEKIYLAGSSPVAFGVADFNGDGKADLAVALGGGEVAVLHGNGDGTFQAPVSYAVNGAPNSIAIGDFNNDGKKDIATLSGTNGMISILTNTGTGFNLNSFTAPTYFPSQYPGTTDYVDQLTAGDVNADGRTDLAYVDSCSDVCGPVVTQELYTLISTASGWTPNIAGHETGTQSLRLLDVDNDGRADLVASYYGCYHNPCTGLEIFYSNANNTFTGVSVVQGYGTGGDPYDAVVADFNNDGLLDIAAPVTGGNDPVTNAPINSGFAVYTGKVGGRSFNAPKYYSVAPGNTPSIIDTGFFNLSGNKDVVMDNGYGVSSLSDFFNLTSRTTDPCPYPTAIGVKFCSPANGATTSSTTVRFRASAHAGTQPANRIELWVDGHKKFQTFNDLLDHTMTLTVGKHSVSAIEVDSAGGTTKSPITITVK